MMLLGCVAFGRMSVSADQVLPLTVPREGKAGFTRLSARETGIHFTNQLSEARSMTNRNLLAGSGVAAGDVNGDGKIDLYFCGLDNSNLLYANRGGLKFEDVTASAGVACAGWDCTGAVFADVDGDGDLDLLVNTLDNGTHLFSNDGEGRFARRADSGLRTGTGSTSLALADIDGDADLDLYVANFRPTTIRDYPATKFSIEYVKGRPVVARVDERPVTAPDLTNRFVLSPSGEVLEYGEADVLYENDGTGRFTAVSFAGGRFLDEKGERLNEAPRDWGLAVQFHDFTGDGAPDLYVCNDYWTPDRIWVNDGQGTFRAAPPTGMRSTSRSSMGVDFADIDRDGDADCLVVDMQARRHRDRQIQVGELVMFFLPPGAIEIQPQHSQNTVQLNRGDGTFAQTGEYCGLAGSEWSWCPIFIDVDLDGWEDVLVSNGHRRNFLDADARNEIQQALASGRITLRQAGEAMSMYPGMETANAAFRNNGDLTFTEVTEQWGFSVPGISHGFCAADLDNDGDLDLAMNNLGSEAGIYRNESNAPRVAVRLAGGGANTSGVGAKVTLHSGSFEQTQEILAGGRYLSGDAMERVFAAPAGEPLSLVIRWRDGRTKTVRDVLPNHRYVIRE